MKGKGLGTFLYAAAAVTIHSKNAILFSSRTPQPDARAAWDRMVSSGWALKTKEREVEPISMVDGRPSPHLADFRFEQGLLAAGFFNKISDKIKEIPPLCVFI